MPRVVSARLLAFLAFLAAAAPAAAQDPATAVVDVTRQSAAKPQQGIIAAESIEGVRLKGVADVIPAGDIVDVNYENHMAIQDRLKTYRPAVKAEEQARTAPDRARRDEKLREALAAYEEALKAMDEKLYAARRHAEFKLGYLRGLLGQGSDKLLDRKTATDQLQGFTKKYPDSWQYTAAMRLLADLQAEQNDVAGAQDTVKKLMAAKVPDAVKQDAQLTLVRYTIGAGKYPEAQAELKKLAAAFPKGSPQQLRARLMSAEVLAAEKKLDEAIKALGGILNEVQDKQLRASAYNTLGECYYRADRLEDARWQFLWVDVIYNEDRAEHAKALFYLWNIFFRLSDFDRAQDFYNTLTAGDRFVGSEWRQRALDRRKMLE